MDSPSGSKLLRSGLLEIRGSEFLYWGWKYNNFIIKVCHIFGFASDFLNVSFCCCCSESVHLCYPWIREEWFLELVKNFPVVGSTEARSSAFLTYTSSVTSGEKPSLFSMTVLNAFSLTNHLDSGISICITLGFAWFFCLFNCLCWLLSNPRLALSHFRHQDTTVCLLIYKGACFSGFFTLTSIYLTWFAPSSHTENLMLWGCGKRSASNLGRVTPNLIPILPCG